MFDEYDAQRFHSITEQMTNIEKLKLKSYKTHDLVGVKWNMHVICGWKGDTQRLSVGL